MRASLLLGATLATTLAGPATGQPGAAVPLGAFRSVELSGGGHVMVRHGAARALRITEGNLAVSRIALSGDRLVIERCPGACPRGYRLEIDLVAPDLDALAVRDGGLLQTEGEFPGQPALAASVESGGLLDLRRLAPERVNASIRQGGAIFVRPGRALEASISNGGLVTYFGDPNVRSSVHDGGAVSHGSDADLDRPLSALQPSPAPPPPVLPVLPLPPAPKG